MLTGICFCADCCFMTQRNSTSRRAQDQPGKGGNHLDGGARRRDRLAESLGALDVTLSADDLTAFEHAVPKGAAARGRYLDLELAFMDSEH